MLAIATNVGTSLIPGFVALGRQSGWAGQVDESWGRGVASGEK